MLKINIRNGWVVTFAGMGVNLALGVLYSWGAFQTVLVSAPYNWSATQSQIPYMIACFVFALLMVPSGRLQDKIGPRKVILMAGVAIFVGLVLSGYFITPIGLAIYFGIIFGLAMSLGYSAPTPAAIKWFSSHRRGLISGIVVGGFGLAGVYVAPLVRYLLAQYGLSHTFIILGIIYGIVIIALAYFIINPPAGYAPRSSSTKLIAKSHLKEESGIDFKWRQVLKTPQFYSLWLMLGIGTLSGLLIIGQLRSIGLEQVSLSGGMAFWLISMYALFNWVGRIGCGIISDKLTPKLTLTIMFIFQAITFALFSTFLTATSIFIGTAIIAFTFGGMLTLFPIITADYFGVKNLGVNYGLVFTAWGIGGVFGPLLGGIVRDITGTYNIAYIVSAILSALGIILVLTIKTPRRIKKQ